MRQYDLMYQHVCNTNGMGLEVRGQIKSLSISMNEHLVSMKDSKIESQSQTPLCITGKAIWLHPIKQMRPV